MVGLQPITFKLALDIPPGSSSNLNGLYSTIDFTLLGNSPFPHAQKEIETSYVHNSRDCSWRQNVIINCKTKLWGKLWKLWTRFSDKKEIHIKISDLW
jgi:hypothetical protein